MAETKAPLPRGRRGGRWVVCVGPCCGTGHWEQQQRLAAVWRAWWVGAGPLASDDDASGSEHHPSISGTA